VSGRSKIERQPNFNSFGMANASTIFVENNLAADDGGRLFLFVN
jgi:hypothetical protein